MKVSTKVTLIGLLLAGWAGLSSSGAPLLVRPVPDKGAGAKTLVVYADSRISFSLGDMLEFLNMQLQRVATSVETVPMSGAVPEKLGAADYLVVFCPQPSPSLTTNFLQAVSEARQPVLWVGFGAERLQSYAPCKGQFEFSAVPAARPATNVSYRGQNWDVTVYLWAEGRLTSDSDSRVVMSVPEPGTARPTQRPVCWQTSNITFFAAVPIGGAQNFLFADVLLDFYGVRDVPPSRVFLRIEDYHCGSNHREFQRMADYLHSRGVPFLVGVTPICHDADSGKPENLEEESDFVTALRYAQQRGGRLILNGYDHEAGKSEFWDVGRDRPLAGETPEFTRERLRKGVRQMFRLDLFPLAWETPHYAASRLAYAEIARVFSTGVERVQLSDSTYLEKGTPSAFTLDSYGRLIVPENLGYALNTTSNALDGIKASGQLLTRLRGVVAGCHIHAYQPLPKLAELVDVLAGFGVPFLDLADLDNAVQIPGYLLLTGDAQRTLTLRNATVRSKTFDRAGKLFAAEEEKARTNGPRTFKRLAGDYQLFEVINENP